MSDRFNGEDIATALIERRTAGKHGACSLDGSGIAKVIQLCQTSERPECPPNWDDVVTGIEIGIALVDLENVAKEAVERLLEL